MGPAIWASELIPLVILTWSQKRNKWTMLSLSFYFYWHFVLCYFGFLSPLISAKSNINCPTVLDWVHIRNFYKSKMWKQTVPCPPSSSKSGSRRTVGLFSSCKSSPSDVGVIKENILMIPGNIKKTVLCSSCWQGYGGSETLIVGGTANPKSHCRNQCDSSSGSWEKICFKIQLYVLEHILKGIFTLTQGYWFIHVHWCPIHTAENLETA